MASYWVAVASREHVKNGESGGFMQVCHGKEAPLKRIKSGDYVLYYSPKEVFGADEPCRKFTAVGKVLDDNCYQFKMSENFVPWRRDVNFFECSEVDIQPLVDKLSFIKNKTKWGYMFRFGLFQIPEQDFDLIASNMGIKV